MIWNQITSDLLQDIYKSDTLINAWLSIYRGEQDWLKYSYVSLDVTPYERTRKTMNAAKFACAELAKLVWAEHPEIVTDQAIEQFLVDNDFYNNAARYSEYGAAGGGFAMKLYSPDGKKLVIDYVPAMCFIPVSWDNKRITEADFIDRKAKDGKTYIRVERHRKTETGYKITYDVFEEYGTTLNKREISVLGIEQKEIEIATPVPLFAYIATPEANNHSFFSPLGSSIYANALGTLESLDIAFDALTQEIVLGKKRIIVPAAAVRYVTSENGTRVRYFDPSDEVFQSFDFANAENFKIQDNTVEMRIDELRLAIQTLLDILANQVGFSAGTFSFDGVSMKTATEVISEQSKTFKTKQAYENNIGRGILELLEAVRAIGPAYGIATTGTEYTVTWNDSVIEDRNSKTDYWLKRYAARTCLLEDVLMYLDGLPEEQAKAKAAEIRASSATIDAGSLFGGGE